MLQTTRGIVFQQVKYSETSLIVKIYTEAFGLQSFIIRGVRKKNAKIKAAHLQHLTLVELEINKRENKDIQHLRSLKIAYPYKDIPFNIRKSTIIIFLNEILSKVIKEEESNADLFAYLFNSLQFLDLTNENIPLFHHIFLIHLTRFLGFFPGNIQDSKLINFDLQEGEFTSIDGPDNLIAKPPLSDYIRKLIQEKFEDLERIKISSAPRNELLALILNYYKLHIPGSLEIKSYSVLSDVFAN